MKTTTIIPGVGVNVDDDSVYFVGDKVTFEGVKKYNLFQRIIRLVFKNAFSKSAPNAIFTVKEKSSTEMIVYPVKCEGK